MATMAVLQPAIAPRLTTPGQTVALIVSKPNWLLPAAVPVVGDFMVELLRGGESVGQSTLTRFYSLHTFVMPWLLAVFMLMHFLMIRKQGISGPL